MLYTSLLLSLFGLLSNSQYLCIDGSPANIAIWWYDGLWTQNGTYNSATVYNKETPGDYLYLYYETDTTQCPDGYDNCWCLDQYDPELDYTTFGCDVYGLNGGTTVTDVDMWWSEEISSSDIDNSSYSGFTVTATSDSTTCTSGDLNSVYSTNSDGCFTISGATYTRIGYSTEEDYDGDYSQTNKIWWNAPQYREGGKILGFAFFDYFFISTYNAGCNSTILDVYGYYYCWCLSESSRAGELDQDTCDLMQPVETISTLPTTEQAWYTYDGVALSAGTVEINTDSEECDACYIKLSFVVLSLSFIVSLFY